MGLAEADPPVLDIAEYAFAGSSGHLGICCAAVEADRSRALLRQCTMVDITEGPRDRLRGRASAMATVEGANGDGACALRRWVGGCLRKG